MKKVLMVVANPATRACATATYIEGGLWRPFAVRDGNLITGQQQHSGRRVAELVIETLGMTR